MTSDIAALLLWIACFGLTLALPLWAIKGEKWIMTGFDIGRWCLYAIMIGGAVACVATEAVYVVWIIRQTVFF
jgi:hypothetical protein